MPITELAKPSRAERLIVLAEKRQLRREQRRREYAKRARLRLSDRYGPHWQRIKEAVWQRDSMRCQVCGVYVGRAPPHHVVKARLGGSHELSNLVLLCAQHHEAAEQEGGNGVDEQQPKT